MKIDLTEWRHLSGLEEAGSRDLERLTKLAAMGDERARVELARLLKRQGENLWKRLVMANTEEVGRILNHTLEAALQGVPEWSTQRRGPRRAHANVWGNDGFSEVRLLVPTQTVHQGVDIHVTLHLSQYGRQPRDPVYLRVYVGPTYDASIEGKLVKRRIRDHMRWEQMVPEEVYESGGIEILADFMQLSQGAVKGHIHDVLKRVRRV